jgi:hypothetical protein
MTGARYTKHRYYAPRVSSPESLRPDFNERAIAFKQINTILSKQATLNPDTSSNAVPSKENSDGKKRTLSSGKDDAPNYGIIWDENAKRKPGQYFKHWVTDREILMASSGLNKEPNYGWVTPKNIDFRTARDKIVKGPQVVITKHKINPKTGKIDKSRDIEVKRLPGKTIAERFPAGKIVNRAASRAGMIVDALGKLRCPPGTPAANQFTDVTGSNCFDVSLSDIGKVIGDLAQAFSMPKASVVDGVDLDSVYAEGSGLRSRSSVSDRVRKIVNRDSGPKRPSEEVLKRARSIANREERMKQAIERRRNAVQVLKDSFGIEGENETLTHFQLLQQLVETGRLNPDFKMDDLLMLPQTDIPNIDGPMYGVNELQRIVEQLVPAALDPNASIEDKLKAHEAVFLHTALLRMGLTDKEALDVVKNYQSGFVDDSTESLRRLATDMWDMQKGYLDGFFELVKNDEKKAKKIILRQAFFDDHTQGDSLPVADSEGNSARLIRYNPLQILGVDRNSVKPLRSDEVLVLSIKEGTEGTDAENAMAIAHEAAQVQSLKEFSRKFGINLAAEEGGFRESGSHLFYHEYSHTLQMDAAEELLRAEGIITSDFTAEEVSNTVLRLLVKPSVLGINIMPSGNEFADGLDIEELIARKLDILGGAYSYSEQGKIIDFLAQGGSKNSAEFKKLRNIALLETTAEMWANRKRGIISDEEVDDVLEWMDREKPRTSLSFDERITITSRPSEPVSVAPDIAEELGIEVPVSPASTPSPAGTSSMSDRIKDGMDIPELEQEAAKIYKKTRSKSKVHEKRKEFIDFFVKNSFGKKSVTELNDKELEILSRALDARADGFIDDGDDRLSKSFKDMASDIRDLIEIRKERRRQLSPGVEPVVKPDSPISPAPTPSSPSAPSAPSRPPTPATPDSPPSDKEPEREPGKKFYNRRKNRQSNIWFRLKEARDSQESGWFGQKKRKITPEEIQKNIDEINQKVNGGGQGRFGGANSNLKFIKEYSEENFGTSDLRELDEDQLRQLKQAVRVESDRAMTASGSEKNPEVGTFQRRNRNIALSLKRFMSSIDDLSDLQAVKEYGIETIPSSKDELLETMTGMAPDVIPNPAPFRGGESIPDSALDIEEPLSDEEWRESLYRNPPSFLQSRTSMAGATGQPSLNSNDRARIQSTINQRRMNAEQYASVADAFSGEAPYIAGSLDIENLSDSLRESAEIRRILTNSALIDKRRQSKSSSGSLMDEQIENYVAPLLSAMDENPTVADFELEIDSSELDGLLSFGGDLAPGTEINHTGFISGNISEEAGLRSMSRRIAGVTGRVLSSERGAQVLGRAGLSEDNIDTVQFGAELASAFLIGGPVGVVGAIARRGSRDAADRALEFARAKGFITPEQASIIESRVLPRLGEGLPPDVLQAIERAATSDAARQGLERARGAAESATRAVRDSDILDEGLDRVRGVAGSARQALSSGDPFAESTDRAREIVGTAREAIKRRASRERASRPGVFESGTAAGWNPDPSKPGQYRYWNGQVWTEHISDPSGNQSIDNNPQLSSQAGWSEYQNGVLSAQSGGSSSDPFGDYSPPSSNQSVYDDPFADMETTPVSSSEWSGAINDPFADFSDPFAYVEQQPEPQQSRSGRIGRLKKGKRNQEQSAPQRDAWDDIFDMSQEQIAEEYG